MGHSTRPARRTRPARTALVAATLAVAAGRPTAAAAALPAVSPAAATLPECTSTQAVPRFGPDSGFDMATIAAVADPDQAPCQGELRVLVVGDSIARGIANGLVALGDPHLKVWDRSTLGCSFNQWDYGRTCPNWRAHWAASVASVRPSVVVLYSTTHTELQGIGATGAAYTSPAAQARRAADMADAVRILAAHGARVVLADVPVPRRPNGLFYCSGLERRSRCDPDWVASWNRSQRDAASATGVPVATFPAWLAGRGDRFTDRPDGLHLSGTALVDHGRWLVPQLAAAAQGPPVVPAPATPPPRTVCTSVRKRAPVLSRTGKVVRWRTATVRDCRVVK